MREDSWSRARRVAVEVYCDVNFKLCQQLSDCRVVKLRHIMERSERAAQLLLQHAASVACAQRNAMYVEPGMVMAGQEAGGEMRDRVLAEIR